MKIWTITTDQDGEGTATAVHMTETNAREHYARIIAASWEDWFGSGAAPMPDDTAKAWEILTMQTGFMDCVVLTEHDISHHPGLHENVGDDPATSAAYLKAARDLFQQDDNCEIDDWAVVSMGDYPGAYVQAWVWVSNEDAGIHNCEECGITYIEGDDSYCGKCADCADTIEDGEDAT